MISNDNSRVCDLRMVKVLNQMINLLEDERKALLSGDASAVTSFASDKEFLAHAVRDMSAGLNEETKKDREIVSLAKKISRLVESNHALLEQMYVHYQGILEVLLRSKGHGSIYDRNGSVDMDFGPKSRAHITA